MCQAASLNQRVPVTSPGEPDRGRPVSDVISEDAKSGPQARFAPAPLLSPLTFDRPDY